MTELRVSEIYASVQGESSFAGQPCVFIRLTGCPLRCVWCDTEYAFRGGEKQPLQHILDAALRFGVPMVELTGGEPLAQREAPELLRALCETFATVLLETSGAYPIADLDPRVHVIMDLKAPGSGESERNLWDNLPALQANDELKFVLADRADYDWSAEVVRQRIVPDPNIADVPIHFSPVHGQLDPKVLVEWILEDQLPVRLQLQQHKYIWAPDTKGV